MFTPSGYKDIEIRKFEFVAKIQFLTRHEFFLWEKKEFRTKDLRYEIVCY